MDRTVFTQLMEGPERLDYEIYLKTGTLLSCQKPLDELVNRDELMFQIVHQVEELWMKLAAYSLMEADDALQDRQVHRFATLMGRASLILKMMTDQLPLLESMSPKDYQTIRLELGSGSGQESPGFRTLLRMAPLLWASFEQGYLQDRTLRQIYDDAYAHDAPYAIAEALLDFDALFAIFRQRHIVLIHRSIGASSASLKGRSVDVLNRGAAQRFFPALWELRSQMTDDWGASYGKVRASLSDPTPVEAG